MKGRYVFSVFSGRSGGEQTTSFLQRNVLGGIARNEYPHYDPTLPGLFGNWQRRFHRRFIETHELLGRGKVIKAFVKGDDVYVEKVARKRWVMIQREMETHNAEIFLDISKCISRGMHTVLDRFVPKYSVLFIVRHPLRNMRSFLNRNKNFLLDNNMPDDSCNLLQMDSANFEKGEYYLWMWCELFLRYQRILSSPNVDKTAILRTEDMNDPEKMKVMLDSLALPYDGICIKPPKNTNINSGLVPTQVTKADEQLLERFLARLADANRRCIEPLNFYAL